MSSIDHILLFLILFIFYCIWGKTGASITDKRKFWFSATLPILMYALILGSRYGWGPDYLSYKFRFEHAFTNPEKEIGFRWLNQAISYLGFNYVTAYISYSLIFIVGAFILIRGYRRESKYMYYFLVPSVLLFVNSAIRQGIALGFVLLGLYYLNQKKWVKLVICILIASSIHTSAIITSAMIGAVYLFIKRPIPWQISIVLYLYAAFLFDSSKLSFIANIMEGVSLDSQFQSYSEDSEYWFGGDVTRSKFAQSTFTLILSSIFYLSIIYLGYQAVKKRPNKDVIYLYNSVVVGIVLLRFVFLYEILRRFAEPLVLLLFIPLGYAYYVIEEERKATHLKLSQGVYRKLPGSSVFFLPNYKLFVYGIFFYLILYWGRFILLNPEAAFVWNI